MTCCPARRELARFRRDDYDPNQPHVIRRLAA